MPRTTAEQLEEVQAAISRVLKGQSWSADGVTYTLADLAALQAREEAVLKRYRSEQPAGGGLTINLIEAAFLGGSDDCICTLSRTVILKTATILLQSVNQAVLVNR